MPGSQPFFDVLNTEHLHADLKGRSVRGGLQTLTAQGTQFLLQTMATVVLARLLTPADFGLVAMVTAVTGLAIMFADLGLSEATIQRKEISHAQVSTLFWINVAIGLVLVLATAGLAFVLAWFYAEPRLKNITLLLSLTFLISGLRVQHDALLKRQMRFASLAIRDVVSYAVAVPAAITMAWRGAGYWALVAFPLIVNSTQMALSWWMVHWRPGLPRRDAQVGSMLAFGGNVAASNLVGYLHRSADNVLIGWYWGAGSLGLYSRAHNLLMLPLRQLAAPVAAVAIPAFSRLQDDPERFARYYLRTLSSIMWISAPLFGLLAVAAEPVIVLVLGNQWRESAPVFQILAISALAQPLLESSGWLFVSRGQSGRLLRLGLVISPIIIASFAMGLPFGIKGVALSYSLVLLTILPWIMKFSFRGTELTLPRLGRALLYPVSLCAVGIVFAALAQHIIAPQRDLSKLGVAALGFAAAYSLSVFIRPVREEVLSFKKLLSELRPSRQAV